ncbi:MAG TPA: hypothetical protein VMV29_23435 [Ktedonobacterales bacterium]|nr:hypothetical protein [Ktedonobacterales bacterium]
MAVPAGYVTIEQAMEQYGHSRGWWSTQIRDGKLLAYDMPGEGRYTFLRVDAIEAYLQPKPRQQNAGQDTDSQSDSQAG